MTDRESYLYRGTVRHTRLEPFKHRFEYRVYYGLFDIDRLDSTERKLKFFSVDRFNLFSLALGDHGATDGTALRPWAEGILERVGVDLDGGSIKLLTYPRVLGYVFNPISIWYCYDRAGELRAVLHEVRNTFGHRHTYVVPIAQNGLKHSTPKKLHVSPFNDMDDVYHFTLTEPGANLSVSMDQERSKGVFFRAGLSLSRIPLTDANLVKLFITHPLLTFKVVAGIHWQALKLWLKGAGYRSVPAPPENQITYVTPERIEV